jgi:hypothetical protein
LLESLKAVAQDGAFENEVNEACFVLESDTKELGMDATGVCYCGS